MVAADQNQDTGVTMIPIEETLTNMGFVEINPTTGLTDIKDEDVLGLEGCPVPAMPFEVYDGNNICLFVGFTRESTIVKSELDMVFVHQSLVDFADWGFQVPEAATLELANIMSAGT